MVMKKRIAFLIPSFIEGSGGIRTIINYMNYLIKCDYECHAYVEGKYNIFQLYELAENYYGANEIIFHAGWKVNEPYDIIFGTVWYSAEVVDSLPIKCNKAYLIQDYEALFNPMGDGFIMAENSYEFGLYPITLGRWLSYKLNTKFGIHSMSIDFGADKKVYFKDLSIKKEELSVAFIFQPEKPRRCYQMGITSLKILKEEIPGVKIFLYGSNQKVDIPFEHINLGILKPEEINELYNKCSVGLCISSSNPSRIPFEMMSAGLPVVDVYMENNLYDLPDTGVLLARPYPNSIACALKKILLDESLRNNLSIGGLEFMKQRDITNEYEQFHKLVESIVKNEFFRKEHSNCRKIYNREQII